MVQVWKTCWMKAPGVPIPLAPRSKLGDPKYMPLDQFSAGLASIRDLSTRIVTKLWKLPGSKFFLGMTKWRPLRIIELSRENPNYEPLAIDSAGLAAVYQRWEDSTYQPPIEAPHPVGLWRIRDGIVQLNSKFASVANSHEIMILPRFEEGPYFFYPSQASANASGVYSSTSSHLLLRSRKKVVSTMEAIYVGTRAATNWGHWLLNFLPGVMLASEHFSSTMAPPLVVPPGYSTGESRFRLFTHFWGERPILECGEDTEIRAANLYWIEQPVADSPRPINRSSIQPKSVNIEVMKRFRSTLLDASGATHNSKPFRKLFLAREPDGKRAYNHDAVHSVAESKGFDIVYLNRLPVMEQISLINQATRVVAPHGSGLANLIFASPGTKVLVLARSDLIEHWFATFPALAGGESHVVIRDGTMENPWEIDPEELGRWLDKF